MNAYRAAVDDLSSDAGPNFLTAKNVSREICSATMASYCRDVNSSWLREAIEHVDIKGEEWMICALHLEDDAELGRVLREAVKSLVTDEVARDAEIEREKKTVLRMIEREEASHE